MTGAQAVRRPPCKKQTQPRERVISSDPVNSSSKNGDYPARPREHVTEQERDNNNKVGLNFLLKKKVEILMGTFNENVPLVPSENKAESASSSFTDLYSLKPHELSSGHNSCPVLGTRDMSVTPILKESPIPSPMLLGDSRPHNIKGPLANS